jgi:outer membrane protein OmpA-like peptidoglycan-associated protein
MGQIISQKNVKISIRNHALLFCFLLIFCVSGYSQTQNTSYVIEEERNQWFIGLGIGPRLFFADHAKQLGFMDRLSGGGDLYIGKWWSPILGTRIGGSWQTLKGATKYSMNRSVNGVRNPGHAIDNRFFIEGPHYLYRQQFNAGQIYADFLFNLSNVFEGVNHDRFWSLIPFIGIGGIGTWDQPSAQEIAFNIGLMNKLRVGNKVDLIFDIRGAIFKERLKNPVRDPDPEPSPKYTDRLNSDTGNRPYDGIFSINIGVAFNFGGNVISKPVYYQHHVEPVPPPANNEVQVITEWKDVAADVLILFRIGQSTLSQDARVQLGFLAKLMHDYPESSYFITGYADEGTGNPNLNLRLSNDRAKRVKDCLVGEFGIAASRLKTTGVGGIENRYYNDPSLSRSVIIRPDKH